LFTFQAIGIIFLVWTAVFAVRIFFMLRKWDKFHPDQKVLRWFHFLMSLTAFFAFLALGIGLVVKNWN